MTKKNFFSSIIITLVIVISSIPYIPMEASASNQQTIYDFLTGNLGFNSAAACGIMANIGEESSFNPTKTESGNGAGYGLCQWTGSRRNDLVSWCNDNGYDYKTISGQLSFLQHELKTDYRSLYNTMLSINNTSDGAYDVASAWCMDFEKPEYRNKVHGQYDIHGNSVTNGGYDKFSAYGGKTYRCLSTKIGMTESEYRGYLAKTQYWPEYGDEDYIVDEELGIPYPRPSGRPYLRKGSKGVYVGWLQYALSEKLGYDIGPSGVDLDFGLATDSALRAFQDDFGLEVDGIAGPATINEICELLSDQGECKLEVASDYITINKNIDQKVSVDCTYYNTRRDVSNVTLEYSCEQKNALTMSWGEWNGRTCPLIIRANSIGTVKVTVKLLNSANDDIMATKDITVVSTGDTAINMSETSVKINLDKKETKDIIATVKCFPRDGKLWYTERSDVAEVTVIDQKIDNTIPIITFRIIPVAAGKEELQFMIKNGSGELVAESRVNLEVVLDTKKVSFDSNGGKCSTMEKVVKYNSEYGVLPVPTREGFEFEGWYTEKDGGTKITEATIMMNASDHTLYAHWKGIGVNITLIDEVSGISEEYISKYGERFNVSMIKRACVSNQNDPTEGKLFIGWSDKPDGKVIISNGEIITPMSGQELGDLTLYARWISPKLSIKVNGQDSYDALPGEVVRVTLEIEDAQYTYGSLGTKISYDQALIPVERNFCSAFRLLNTSCSLNDGIIMISCEGSSNSGLDGAGCYFDFLVPENANRGTVYPFELINDEYFTFTNIEDNSTGKEMQKYISSHCNGCQLRVKEFKVGETEVMLQNGEQYRISTDEERVIYSSNNTRVAVVSKDGCITAVGEGTAKISAISEDSEVVQIEVTVTSSKTLDSDTMYGDVNLDGKITAADATAIMQYIANRDKYSITEKGLINADVYNNGDGVTAMDALVIQQFDSGLISEIDLLSMK